MAAQDEKVTFLPIIKWIPINPDIVDNHEQESCRYNWNQFTEYHGEDLVRTSEGGHIEKSAAKSETDLELSCHPASQHVDRIGFNENISGHRTQDISGHTAEYTKVYLYVKCVMLKQVLPKFPCNKTTV